MNLGQRQRQNTLWAFTACTLLCSSTCPAQLLGSPALLACHCCTPFPTPSFINSDMQLLLALVNLSQGGTGSRQLKIAVKRTQYYFC